MLDFLKKLFGKKELPVEAVSIKESKPAVKQKYGSGSQQWPSGYDAAQLHRLILQILESLTLISSSKNCDTIIGRFELLRGIYGGLEPYINSPRYISDVQTGIDYFKTAYYDKTLHDYHIALLIDPNRNLLEIVYAEALYNCLCDYYQSEKETVASMKQKPAMVKRYEKIKTTASAVRKQIGIFGGGSKHFEKMQNEIMKMQDEVSWFLHENKDKTK